MKYYVSWGDSDPIFHHYLPTVGVLVNPLSVARIWQPTRWPSQPQTLLLDSGGYQSRATPQRLTPSDLLSRQLELARLSQGSVGFCHLDVSLAGTRRVSDLKQRMADSLANAQTFMNLLRDTPLSSHITPIGVIQGYSVETVFYAGQVLADMGFTNFALGSLAGMVASARNQLIRRVEAAVESVGTNLHILGVSSIAVLDELRHLGIRSVDSSAPMHEAWRGGLFYSDPFRRYKLNSPYFKEWARSYRFADILSEPLPCNCPICQEDPTRLLNPMGRQAVFHRAIHNCFHLMHAVEGGSSLPIADA